MKIVHVAGYFVPELGYQEYYIAKKHAELGHDVHVITSDKFYPFANIETMLKEAGVKNTSRKRKAGFSIVEGIKIHRLKSFFEFTDLILCSGLKETLRKIKPDVVISHECRQGLPSLAGLWKRELGYKFIIDQHDFWHKVKNHGPLMKTARYLEYELFRKPIANIGLKRADALIGVTPESKQFLVERHGIPANKIDMIRLGVLTERFTFDQKLRKKIRSKYKIKDDEVLLMYSGNIYPRKYLELLIEAFPKIKSKKAKVLIVGTGQKEYMNKLKSMVKERNLEKKIIFAGFINQKELRAYYSASDIAIWVNNNSISIMEAMACKRPVILPAQQLVDFAKYHNGIAFPSLNKRKLIEAIDTLVGNKKLREQMGKNGHKAIMDNFDYMKIAKDFLKVAQRVLSK